MMRSCVLTLVFCSAVEAAPPAGPRPGEVRRERAEQRLRTLRAVGIAEVLGLDAAGALKLDQQLRAFDDRRRPLRSQLEEAMKIIRKAAEGDPAATPGVDAATRRILDLRAQLATIDREVFNAVAEGRSPQEKARLILFFAQFPVEARALDRLNRMPGPRRAPGAREPAAETD